MNAQLRQRRAVGEAEVAHDEIALMAGGGPFCPSAVTRFCRLRVLGGSDRGSQDYHSGAQGAAQRM
jgi:hypothetical protein